ncbi:DNA-directed RNA polymerase subunit H [Candidatus Woesearchaeota archaeon]|nr:DNA-directed RNA polymerase subunit H [Candidatus Woesearchaeota archaeon]
MAEKKSDMNAHELVPEHTKLSEKDAKALFKKYNITLREIPKINFSDPAIAHLGARQGDVIKIKRHSRTAGETVYYRGVIRE